ncbi:DUF4892 domain-containing protein [Marinomonas epiphytica]
MVKSVPLMSVLLLSSTSLLADFTDIPPFREAQLVKSASLEQQRVEVPLGVIKRVGRGWEPEKLDRIEADTYQVLYKIHRNVELDEVNRYYRQALLAEGQQIAFQCDGRNCGSSNAWANNFYREYLLYGADQNQSLLVVKDQFKGYQMAYINQRGAGDIVVRLDDIKPIKSDDFQFELMAQMDAQDLPRIRRFLNDQPEGVNLIGLVTSSDSGGQSAIDRADQYITSIEAGLSERLARKVRWLNLANLAREELGEDQVSFMLQEAQ